MMMHGQDISNLKRNQASSSFSGERFEGIRGVNETLEFCRENLA